MPRRVILGMTGATGAVFGVELLRRLRNQPDVETHLVLSQWAKATIHLETSLSVREVTDLADVTYSWNDQGAAISSGSFRIDGMIIAPCSMKTLAGIRTGYADGLIPAPPMSRSKSGVPGAGAEETRSVKSISTTCWHSPVWERESFRRCRPSTAARKASTN